MVDNRSLQINCMMFDNLPYFLSNQLCHQFLQIPYPPYPQRTELGMLEVLSIYHKRLSYHVSLSLFSPSVRDIYMTKPKKLWFQIILASARMKVWEGVKIGPIIIIFFITFWYLPSSSISPCVRTVWMVMWLRHLVWPCYVALGRDLICGCIQIWSPYLTVMG